MVREERVCQEGGVISEIPLLIRVINQLGARCIETKRNMEEVRQKLEYPLSVLRPDIEEYKAAPSSIARTFTPRTPMPTAYSITM
jgi:hypothetical protein